MASEHLMKASLAHLPDGGCSHSLPGGGVAHCAHCTTPFSLLQPQISCQVLLATCLLNPFSSPVSRSPVTQPAGKG